MSASSGGWDDTTQALLASIVESSDDAILSKTLDGRITSWNAGAERLYGYAAGEIVGQPVSVLAPPERVGDIERIMERIALGERIDHFETERVRKDGTRVHVSLTISPVRDASGAVVGASTIARDITERRRSEAEISKLLLRERSALAASRESEDRFRAMADHAPVLIWTADATKRCDYVNKPWLDFTGRALEQEAGDGWLAGLHPDDVDRCIAAYAAAFDARERFRMEYRLRRADGVYRWFLVTGIPRRLSGGEFVGYIGSCVDITEGVEAQAQLERSNERFRLAASAVSAVIYEWNLATSEVFRTQGLLDVVGFRPEEVPSTSEWWYERIHPEDVDRAREQLLSSIDHAGGFTAEYRVRHRNETYVYVWDQGIVERDAAGSPVRVVGSTQNVNERRRAEEDRDRLLVREQHARREAEEASRVKDEFLATVSHELRTPLNAILGWSRMLGGGSLDETTFSRGIEAVQRNALSLTELVNDLLDVSRVISGNLRLDVRAVELSGVVKAAVDSVRPSADAKGIRLQTVLDPRAGPVLGDPERLQQVVWNLLSNAIKFSPKGGRVQVQLERINSHVELSVSDTGAGIGEDFLPYVFDRFRQADASITRKHGGLGLGLSIVRHLVELHGGVVHAESGGEDKGATFTVRLPVMVVRREPHDPARVHPAAGDAGALDCPPNLRDLRVLVVDDEPDTCEILAIVLEQCEAVVETCLSAAEALEALDRAPIDVLISDIGMPGMDGYELIRRVRERPAEASGRVPAIALTAFARVEDRVRVLSAGFQAHVGKPVEPAELLAVVASLAGRSGPPREG